ncbi:MAG: GlcG/HbpS family heme-binding protein, partial [Alphaproteobacteria bacterium]
MFKGTTFACALVLGLAFGASVHAQVVMQPNVSLELAREIADATLAACNAAGFDTSVAVVDRAGHTMILLRGTTSSPQTAEMARRKAYTARMWR